MLTAYYTDIQSKFVGVIIFAFGDGTIWSARHMIKIGHQKSAFICTTVSVVLTSLAWFVALFPRLMVSSLSPDFSLTIYNAASTDYTLTIMTVAAVLFVPVVLLYQSWTYKIFKDRVTPADVHH